MTISSESHTSTSYKGKLKQECTFDREPFTEKGNDGVHLFVRFIFIRYESCIDAEIQQRAVECVALSRKGEALMDILA
ncbi:hypothetical protein L2E82_11361 [Cichorium intybus]|uniref:Uncharacterized protein n=1 Tax=Cichorium intybus TaxID=13427 RepID=A0ACB9GDS8_CICIN|nr:hypothetical protein L2E82_11361 [Cichorium intybus]